VDGLRIVIANCEVKAFSDTFTTTVTIEVPLGANIVEVNERLRQQAAAQINDLYHVGIHENQVIVLHAEDTTFILEPTSGE